ncbi:diguanylate cyclase [Fischerella thermalis CCMEE 5330]|uniref:Diguanylate cyclase n=1 Tax=Fischerella thermalis CCMEE 5330 TaxID=2019670 RepID=A0A2N6LWN9_9CYAN|nr:PAS domain S-box protein [Fischerella thermalis]PMB38927.1 diguanylate cyclase [Fischerella thermalis CCMEE 5330]
MYQECGHYYLCQLKLAWLDATSNSAITFAYNLIPIIVVYSARKQQDLPFQWIYRLITTLAVIGTTIYLIEAWMFWRSQYWLLGLLKAITAFGLLCAMILLVRSLPKVLTIPNLTELKQANHQLELEIKERHFAEEALRESKERFHNAFDHAAIGMALVGLNGSWLQVNHSLCEIVGYSEAELLSKTCQEITHPDDLDTDFEYVRQLLTGEIRCYHMSKRYIHKLGHVVWIMLSVSLVCDIHGQPLYFITQIQDITERKRVEQTLQQQAYIFENISDGVIVTDLSGRVIDWNRAAEKMFGYSKAEVLGKNLGILHKPEESAVLTQKIIDELHTANRWAGEINFVRKDGTQGVCETVFVPLYNAHGQPTATIGVNRNITERKQAEAALQQANEQLTSWVQQLEQRNHEIALLSQMSDILQACLTVEEAYKVIAQLIQPLFPETSGGVFIISSSKHLVEAVTTWGDSTVASKKVFSPKNCWALRRGRSHFATADDHSLHCSHIEEDLFGGEALCVPMMAQGEALGMLHFHSLQTGQLTAAKQQLASAVAERIALALANLRLTEALQQQSIRDPLTGLFNRRYLEESLEREISRAERSQKRVGIIMMDVDHFKSFNDRFGHEAGDIVLRELGGFLRKQIRKADIACRYGGEEIMLILPETCLDVCQERAERIRQTVKHLDIQYQRQKLGCISLSLGVAMYPEHGLTGTAVIEAADAALYIAKKTGRDRVVMAQSQVSVY